MYMSYNITKLLEKILKKYKRKHKNQLLKMKKIEYKGILLAKIIIWKRNNGKRELRSEMNVSLFIMRRMITI